MNDFERRLADLLHTGTPEPDRIITASRIAELAQGEFPSNRRRVQRWGVPLMAAAAVLVAVAVPVFVIGRTVNSATPTPPPQSAQTSAPTSSPSSTANITTGSVATCLNGQLSLTVGRREGAAGSSYATFYLAITTGTPCTVRGFPGVSLLDDAGIIVGRPATRDGSEGPPVRLGPGQRAQFTLRMSTATQTGCDLPRPSSQVQVYPPDQTVALRIPFTTASCAISVQSLIAAP